MTTFDNGNEMISVLSVIKITKLIDVVAFDVWKPTSLLNLEKRKKFFPVRKE